MTQRVGKPYRLRHGVRVFAPVIEGFKYQTSPVQIRVLRTPRGSNGNLRISFTGCPEARVEKRMA